MNSLNHTTDIEIISGICDDLFSEIVTLNIDQNQDSSNNSANASIKQPISEIHNVELSDTTEYNADLNCHNNLTNNVVVSLQTKHPIIAVSCNQGLSQTVTHVNSRKDPATSLKEEKSIFTQNHNARKSGLNSRGIFKYLNNSYNSTNLKKKSFVCDICNKDFFYKHQLNVHYRTHHKGNLFLCKICNKRFTEKHFLDTHFCIHKEQFVCEICSEHFFLRADLDAHLHSHQENPYTCEICKDNFSMRFTLNAHLRTHRRLFVCDTCSKSYALRTDFDIHLRTHVKEEPYIGEICNKSTLNKPLQGHTDTKPCIKLEESLCKTDSNDNVSDQCCLQKNANSKSCRRVKKEVT